MIAEHTVAEVRRLLDEGKLSHRKIAARLGLGRGSVDAIASGKRPDYAERLRRRALEDEWYQQLGPLTRCPDCGGQVHMPCRLCRVRAIQDEEQAIRRQARRTAREIALRQFLAALLRRQLQREAVADSPSRNLGALTRSA